MPTHCNRMNPNDKSLSMPSSSGDGPRSGVTTGTASMKPPPLLSRRRFKGNPETADDGTELSLENQNLKFEKQVLEQLIKDKEVRLEKLNRSFGDQSLKLREMSKLQRFNSSLSLESLKNINNAIFKALEDERKKHEDERRKQDEALQRIDQLEKVTLAVLEREIMRVKSVESEHNKDVTSQDDIPIVLRPGFI